MYATESLHRRMRFTVAQMLELMAAGMTDVEILNDPQIRNPKICTTQRSNEAVGKICGIINDTKTIYPGTNLRLNYKIATVQSVPDKEF